MRAVLATLSLVLALPAAAAADDPYTGRWSGACGDLACELTIEPAGAGRWSVEWTATDPTDFDLLPLCSISTTAAIGTVVLGPVGEVDGIAVGRVKGKPFGIFPLEPGRISWSSTWEACPGIAPKGYYGELGD
ncbi:hypothetical protein [Antarcticirhabdus aurantiaca]|uniref:hypothetical protein n=1 Tax=Antarcticirhabdus aurantiaca TaxID=2606717 RepID=UPI00131B2356|nr:hypothetical protein [Antarcticirhabdus aurantiaca]